MIVQTRRAIERDREYVCACVCSCSMANETNDAITLHAIQEQEKKSVQVVKDTMFICELLIKLGILAMFMLHADITFVKKADTVKVHGFRNPWHSKRGSNT